MYGGYYVDENENKAVLDAFFLGKAFAEALNERIGSTVGEILSVVGQWQAEQQKQVLDFQVIRYNENFIYLFIWANVCIVTLSSSHLFPCRMKYWRERKERKSEPPLRLLSRKEMFQRASQDEEMMVWVRLSYR